MKQIHVGPRKKILKKFCANQNDLVELQIFFSLFKFFFSFSLSEIFFFSQKLSKIWSSLSSTISTPVIRFIYASSPDKPREMTERYPSKACAEAEDDTENENLFSCSFAAWEEKILFVIRSRLSVSSSLAETCEKENVCLSSGAREKRKEKCFIRFTLSLKTKKVGGKRKLLRWQLSVVRWRVFGCRRCRTRSPAIDDRLWRKVAPSTAIVCLWETSSSRWNVHRPFRLRDALARELSKFTGVRASGTRCDIKTFHKRLFLAAEM